jgi:hypothetical protein
VACRAKGDPSTGDITVGWEVIMIRRQKPYERFGNKYPSKELYPSDGLWGTTAWSYNNFPDAMNKFKSLLNIQMPKFASGGLHHGPKT